MGIERQWGQHAAKRCALASFPRSGNTWVRYMIENITGQCSGSIYNDRVLPRGRQGVVVKTHALDSVEYDAAILIVRHPLDAISSYFHWRRDIAGEKHIDWESHVLKAADEWEAHGRHWLNAACPLHRIRYEDLIVDTAHVMTGVAAWLGYATEQSLVLEAVQNASIERMRKLTPLGQQFFRGSGSTGRGEYGSELEATLRERLKPLLSAFGY